MTLATVLGLYAGEPTTLRLPGGGTMRSALRKAPLRGRVPIGPDGLPGDGSQERMHHLPEMALHAFAHSRYAELEARAGFAFPPPAFGENLSLDGGEESAVCVGDVLTLGSARLEVSQPTIRCAKLGRNLGEPRLLGLIESTGACGYYLRVLTPGEASPGDALVLESRPHPEWTVARLHAAMFAGDDADRIGEILALPALGPRWTSSLRKRARVR